MKAQLTLQEQDALDKWVARNDVQKILRQGGQLAVIWGPNNGIGVPVRATVRNESKELTIDLTDYQSW